MIKLCDHLKENGIYCQSAALRGRNYCYFHLRFRGRRMAMAQARARRQNWSLSLPPLEDMHAVQVAVMQVIDAIVDDRLEQRRAGLLLYGLQQAATNLQSFGPWNGRKPYEINPETELRAVEDPAFERDLSLPKRLDLGMPPEQAFPPPPSPEELQRAQFALSIAESQRQQAAAEARQLAEAQAARAVNAATGVHESSATVANQPDSVSKNGEPGKLGETNATAESAAKRPAGSAASVKAPTVVLATTPSAISAKSDSVASARTMPAKSMSRKARKAALRIAPNPLNKCPQLPPLTKDTMALYFKEVQSLGR